MKPFFFLVVLVLASTARADERFDHRGSVGLLLGTTGEYKAATSLGGGGDEGFRLGTELGATYSIGSDGNEVKAAVRTLFGGIEAGCSARQTCAPVDIGIFFGYRGYFDLGHWKTFFDIDAAQHFVPRLSPASANSQLYTIGPRIGIGVQLDFLPVAGAFAILEAQIGFGDGLRYGAALMIGVQLRSYLLE